MTAVPLIYVAETCRVGQGAACCAFLVMGDEFECAKGSTLDAPIRARLAAGDMVAQGENCAGL